MSRKNKRRTHYKVEKLSCREMIDKMLQEGYTYEEIVEAVDAKGEEISDSSLSRYHRSLTKRLEDIQRTKQSIKTLVEQSREDPDLDISKATNNLLMDRLFNRSFEASSKEFEDLDIEKVIRLSALLERSGVTRERLKMEHNKGVRAAVVRIKNSLPHEIKAYPELHEKICQLIDQIGEEMMSDGTSRTAGA